jgi:hypothetical protein
MSNYPYILYFPEVVDKISAEMNIPRNSVDKISTEMNTPRNSNDR